MNQIMPYPIWVGHAGHARDFKAIYAKEIRAVVQLAAEKAPVQAPRELILYRFPLVDGSGNDPDVLRLAVGTVAQLIENQIATLVCCGAGMSRSPAVVAAALSLAKKIKPEQAIKLVASHRPVDLSPGLWTELKQLMKLGNEKGSDCVASPRVWKLSLLIRNSKSLLPIPSLVYHSDTEGMP